MKLLFDENLSRKLVVRLAELYPDSIHVAQAISTPAARRHRLSLFAVSLLSASQLCSDKH